MHVNLLLLLTAILTIVTVCCAAYGRNSLILLLLALASSAGIILAVLFPLAATRANDSPPIVSEESYELLSVERDEELYYLFQNDESLQFVYYIEDKGLVLGAASLDSVIVTYQEDINTVFITKSISTHHNQWLFLKDSVVTETEYVWHFFIPKKAVWYPY